MFTDAVEELETLPGKISLLRTFQVKTLVQSSSVDLTLHGKVEYLESSAQNTNSVGIIEPWTIN